ncbi:MAG: hypothetical protein CVT89_06070 [Candidatus Altiarchaeales archaeon HGW-Altiarchaeales-2]|nr:MAG: hypothetical protein CVT89_06070 [Candidatus Altiarchaeales archaeon HGW-Altiarchaeales-2]
MADKIKTEEFYRLWISETDNLLEGYLYNEERKLYSTRDKFFYYCSLLERFLNNQIDEVEKIRDFLCFKIYSGIPKTKLFKNN